jgi:hypothetical protein
MSISLVSFLNSLLHSATNVAIPTMAGAFALLQGVNANTPVFLIVVSLMTLGLGFGLFTTPNNNAALSSIDNSRLSIGVALLSLSRVVAISFCYTLGAAYFSYTRGRLR